MATLEIKNDLDSFKQSLTRKATTKIPVVKKKPNFKDVNLTTIQAQARTPVFKSVTTPRKYTTPTKKPKIELPKYTPFTQEEVGLLQHQTRLPMALPKSNLTSKAATNTEYALKSNPTAYGFMEGFSPLATKKQLSKQLGQEIDTTGAEDTLGYKVGYGAGLMGQYAITGGIAHAGVRQGLTRMIPQLANQAGRSTVKNVLGTMGASALTDVLTGVPVNTLQAIKESTIGDNVNWNQFAKSFAVNTAIDVVFGGLIEGGIALKSGKKIKTVGDLKTVTPDESKEFMTHIERLAYESNVRKGKIIPQNDTLYGNAFTQPTGELPAPKIEYEDVVVDKIVQKEQKYIDEVYKNQYNDIDSIKKQLSKYYTNEDGGASDVAAQAIADLKKAENSISNATGKMDWNTRTKKTNSLRSDFEGQGKIIGKAFSDELIDTGRVNLAGIKFKSVDDLAAISHVYRDPRFETFRIIYTKGDEVVDIEAVSSRLPSSSRVFITDVPTGIKKMNEKMQRINADGYYLLHNHPSGSVKPSQADIQMTSRLLTGVKGFRSHIIINSNKFTEFFQNSPSTFGSREDVALDLGMDILTEQSKPHPMIGSSIDSADTFAKIAKQMQLDSPNQSIIFFVNAKGEIKAIMEVDNRFMNKNPIEFRNFVKNRAIDNGGASSFIQLGENANEKIAKEFVENGIFLDALKKDGTSFRTQGVVDKTTPDDWMGINVKNVIFKAKTAKTKIDPMHNKLKKVNVVEKVVERRQKQLEPYVNNRANREVPRTITPNEFVETDIAPKSMKRLEPNTAQIPAREPVSTVEPVKSTKPTLTPKTEKVASNVTKTEKSYFDTITNVTEKTKAEKRLGENITFVNNKGNLTKATRKEYIEDMAMIDGSQIKTIQKLRTNGGKTFEVNEYRVYKTPNSKEPIKISKYEKDYFDFAKKNQDNVVQSVTPYKKPIKKVDKSLPPKNTTNPIDLVMASSKNAQKGFKESVIDRGLEVKRKFVDSGDTVAIIGKITGDKGLYHSYNKARSSTRSAEHVLGEAQTNIIGDKVGESLKDIFKPIRKKGDGYYNDFQLYLLHKHNVDRMAQGKPVFGEDITADISIAEAKSLLKEYPEFEELAQKIYKFNKNNMQYRVDADLITAEQAKMFEEMYPHYVPTIRAKKSFPQPPKNSKTDVTGKIAQTIKEATGDSSPILPLHESMARQTMQIVTASEKNIFANRLIKNVTPETSRYIQDINVIAKDFNPDDELINAMKSKKESEELKNYFTLFRNGEAYQVKVDEGLFEGLEALTSSNRSTDAIIEAITAGNTMFKQLITGYSPTFLVRNGARDLQDVGIYSKNLREFAIQYPKAIKEMTSNGELWQRYKALGGTGSSFFDYAKGFKKDPTFLRKNTLNKIENLNMAVEQLPRFTEFMATLSKGDGSYDNLLEALYNSADITVNFGRTGTWGKTLNQTFVPFFNPAMQGFDKLARTLKYTKGWKDWTKLTIKATALGITPALINEIVYSDDPDYANLYSRDKDINYLFKLDNNVWIRIPKGRVLSLIGGAAQRTVRLASGDKDAYAGFLKVVKEQVAPISPFESNIVSPILAVQNNKAWHGGTIEPQRLTGSAGLRYDESTTIPAKWLGAKLNYSPKKIDYLVDAYTGIIGDLAIPLTTPKAEVHPFAKAFTIDGATTNRISQDFYDKKTEISESYSDNKDNTSYIQNRYLNKQSDMASELFEEIRTVQNSKLTDVQKRTKVREIRALINVIEKNALDSLPEVEKATKKLVNKYPDTDDLYREVNREVFGSEYALKLYNKTVYEKAQTYVTEKAAPSFNKNVATIPQKNGITWDNYYDGYFAQKDKPSDIGKAVALKSENIDTLFVAFDISDKNARIGAAIYENDLSYIYETTYRRIDENNATKSAEKIAIIRQHNPNLTRQQLNILYEAFNVAESIGGYRRQFK